MSIITVNVYREDIFIYGPFRYHNATTDVLTETDFSGFTFMELFDFVRKMCPLDIVRNLYYKIPSHPITELKQLKNDDDMKGFIETGYANNDEIDLYVEHTGEDIIEMIRDIPTFVEPQSDHSEYSDDGFELRNDIPDYIELEMEGEEHVKIPKKKLHDQWLYSLCDGNYIRLGKRVREGNSNNEGLRVDEQAEKDIPDKYKVRDGVRYPSHDPTQPWNLMKPILGMRFESPEHLKFALANYGVANGYQLWYPRNDWQSLLVRCDRNVDEGRCSSKRGHKNKIEDSICPSVRKHLENLKKQSARNWRVLHSGYEEFEVYKIDDSLGVNLETKKCDCRMWELSGVPCVHAVSAYMFIKMDPAEGVSPWFEKAKWQDAYAFSIRPVRGSKHWRKVDNEPPLPPIQRKMPGRPKKKRVRHATEESQRVSRVGRQMTCKNCHEKGHNRKTCKVKNASTSAAEETHVEHVDPIPQEMERNVEDQHLDDFATQEATQESHNVSQSSKKRELAEPRRPSERVLKRKLAKEVVAKDGSGTSSKPIVMD